MNKKLEEILSLIAVHPELPIIPMVGGDIVADDGYSYWTASWGSAEVKKLCVTDERVIFWDDDSIWETWEDLGLDYDDLGITEDPPDKEAEEKALKILNSLDWIEAIVVYIETPDPNIPDNTAKIRRLYEEGRV